jgi:hypothetical protein
MSGRLGDLCRHLTSLRREKATKPLAPARSKSSTCADPSQDGHQDDDREADSEADSEAWLDRFFLIPITHKFVAAMLLIPLMDSGLIGKLLKKGSMQ